MKQQFKTIGRRGFLVLGSAAAGWQLWRAGAAGPAAKPPRIGWLSAITEPESRRGINSFRAALAKLGWTDGTNCLLETRFADGQSQHLTALAAEMANAGYDVLVASQLPVAKLLANLAPATPMVISSPVDPVALHFAGSIAHPGGNITGLSIQADAIAQKRLSLLYEALPNMKVLGYVYSRDAKIDLDVAEFEKLAPSLGVSLKPVEISNLDDFEAALPGLGPGSQTALFLFASAKTYTLRAQLAESATRLGVPTMGEANIFTRDGTLMAYSADQSTTEALLAGYVDQILRGAKAGDLPFAQPVNFALTINLKTAARLGLALSPVFLARADDVVE